MPSTIETAVAAASPENWKIQGPKIRTAPTR
jgi:hypothetical protein